MVAMGQRFFVDKFQPVPIGTKEDRARAQRLKQLRAVMGYQSQRQFAQFLGVEYARYNNAERGLPLSRQMADIIVARCPGAGRNWLYDGDAGDLSVKLARALGELPKGFMKGKTSAD